MTDTLSSRQAWGTIAREKLRFVRATARGTEVAA